MIHTHIYSLFWHGESFMPGEEHRWWFTIDTNLQAGVVSINAHPFGGFGEPRHVELKVKEMSSAVDYIDYGNIAYSRAIYFTVVNMGPDPEMQYSVNILWATKT